jgi:hypothetical protein
MLPLLPPIDAVSARTGPITTVPPESV